MQVAGDACFFVLFCRNLVTEMQKYRNQKSPSGEKQTENNTFWNAVKTRITDEISEKLQEIFWCAQLSHRAEIGPECLR